MCAAAAKADQEARSENTILVGETRVRLVVMEVKAGTPGAFVYFHPHENEHGSAVVTRHAIRERGGRLVEIRSEGDRLITFRVKGATYSFDPNRMFTDIGLEHSLSHFGPSSPPAVECARLLRDAVIKQLGGGKTPIIAVHNNAEGDISVLAYRKGGALAEHAARVAVNPKEKPHNFFLVLDETIFKRLHHAGFNTVLQSPDSPDDGSLSVFCQQHNWPYINIAAAESDINQQQRMLESIPAVME